MLSTVAELMAISAETAPKAGGQSFLVFEIITGDKVKKLAEDMINMTEIFSDRHFIRDGKNVENSAGILLIGMKGATTVSLNCGACGYETCNKMKEVKPIEGKSFLGPVCAVRYIDFGIAIGSAVKTASLLNIDNRIMYRIGVAARKKGYINADIVMGIPLSITGKSPFFDR
ncbi:MAG: hypothetical protein HY934_07640 [Candidatus Firestonebacteria bacterium]|nr:hypothetical protein [Candidatus Firestonebacteria bacterium]